jgi:hypothetical protein
MAPAAGSACPTRDLAAESASGTRPPCSTASAALTSMGSPAGHAQALRMLWRSSPKSCIERGASELPNRLQAWSCHCTAGQGMGSQDNSLSSITRWPWFATVRVGLILMGAWGCLTWIHKNYCALTPCPSTLCQRKTTAALPLLINQALAPRWTQGASHEPHPEACRCRASPAC